MDALGTTLREVRVGEPVTVRNLTMFPLFGPAVTDPGYLVMDDALSTGKLKITEVSGGGSVPEVKVVNRLDLPVLILDGEELVGAKQNRVANLTILSPARKEIRIPVSCVEEGRWHHTSDEFAVAQTVVFAAARARKARDVSIALDATRGRSRRSDQGAVWKSIADRIERLGVPSDTYAMDDVFDVMEERIKEYGEGFKPMRGQIGACFAIGGTVVGLELFDTPSTFGKLAPKLVRSYALDALGVAPSPAAVTTLQAQAFLQKALLAKREAFPAIGEGEDVRFTDDGVVGGALVARGRVVHAAVFDARAQDLVGVGGLAPSGAAGRRTRVLSEDVIWPEDDDEEWSEEDEE